MSELSPKAKALLQHSRLAGGPTSAQRRAMRDAVVAGAATGLTAGVLAKSAASASASPSTAAATASVVGGGTVLKLVILGVSASVVGAGATFSVVRASRQSAPSTAVAGPAVSPARASDFSPPKVQPLPALPAPSREVASAPLEAVEAQPELGPAAPAPDVHLPRLQPPPALAPPSREAGSTSVEAVEAKPERRSAAHLPDLNAARMPESRAPRLQPLPALAPTSREVASARIDVVQAQAERGATARAGRQAGAATVTADPEGVAASAGLATSAPPAAQQRPTAPSGTAPPTNARAREPLGAKTSSPITAQPHAVERGPALETQRGAPSPPQATPALHERGSLEAELSALDAIATALEAGHAADARDDAQRFRRQFPDAALLPEALVLEVLAHCALGDVDQARALAQSLPPQAERTPAASRLKTSCVGTRPGR